MKNILESKITIKGAWNHWSGDVNNTTVSPKIIIEGINPDGTPYGVIKAEVSGVSTDGGSESSLWSIHIPFGRFERTFYDKPRFRGADGSLYEKINQINPDNRQYVEWCDVVEITIPYIGKCWEIVNTSPKRAFSDFEKDLYGSNLPMKYETLFRFMPTLAQIDDKWEKLMEMGVESLSVKDDKVVVFNGQTYIDFDEV